MGDIPSSLIASSIPIAPLKFSSPSFIPCDIAVLKDHTSLDLQCPVVSPASEPDAAPAAAAPPPAEAVVAAAAGGVDILVPPNLLCGRLSRLLAGATSNAKTRTRPMGLKLLGIHVAQLDPALRSPSADANFTCQATEMLVNNQ